VLMHLYQHFYYFIKKKWYLLSKYSKLKEGNNVANIYDNMNDQIFFLHIKAKYSWSPFRVKDYKNSIKRMKKMRETKIDRENVPIRMIIIISFIILMLATVSLVGYIVFSNWLSSADEIITEMAEDMDIEIYNQIDTFLHVPMHINEVNKGLIENGAIDIYNEIEREMFFVGVLKAHSGEAVYSFSYGTEAGEYYGARRNENNVIEIMRNNADTGGYSWYYSVTGDMTAGERVVEAGKFDSRTRDWYKAAKETQKLVFSPMYKHFVMDDLTVSAAVPIYNKDGELQGVLGTHITLARIDNYLKEIAKDKNAVALIIEKNSGELIANSLDMANFKTLEDGTIKRLTIEEIDNQAIIQSHKNYNSTEDNSFKIDNEDDRLYVNLTEYNKEGLDWLVITAVPESLLKAGIVKNMKVTILLILVALILSIVIYLKLTNKFLKPIDNLIDTTEKLSRGDLSQRAAIIRNDEIGRISKSFNKMADTIFMLVNNLETKVKERTVELEETNNALKENKEQLQLILDSTAEAIYGMDINANCTFCNASGLKMLGYKHQDELIGKNMHLQIHRTRKDGTSIPLDECKIYQAFIVGKGTRVDDEVFWRADGTNFNVEYYSYPQYKDGKIIGAVVTFMDNTERKKNEEYIKYLSYHDSLTGLYNRMFFEDELKRIDTKNNLPISIIFGDVNGLKLTNDIFGHAAGDALLKKSAEILKKVCREEDIIARVGGDEFAIFLPNTEASEAEKIIDRIKNELSKEQIVAIKCSMSMGYDTKTGTDQKIERTMENAEAGMYKVKMLNRKTINSYMVNTIIETLHNKNPREKGHSITVSEICHDIGQAMKMPETEVRKLKEAGFLHDIGKIVLDEDILNKEGALTEEEKIEMQQHSILGYRILNLFDDTLDLAEGVLNHHENWDGSGYPKGLKGEEIPMLARVIRVAESYDAMTNSLRKNTMRKEKALQKIKNKSGIIFDTEIVDVFINLMR